MWDAWEESFWLPENVSWNDMKDNENAHYPHAADLIYTIILGFMLLVLRLVLESVVFIPIGWWGGWIRSPVLPRIWVHITGRLKLLIMLREPHLKDVSECWRGWPHHNISDSIWWYYILETSFYWALLIGTLFIDIRRADFKQMMFHHAITILLLYLSWAMNMVRVGTLVLFIHDAADIFIEMAKIARYAQWKGALTILFVIFIVVWTTTRLIYYPFWILWSVWFDAPELIQSSYQWTNIWQRPIVPRILMVMLSLLLILHIFWTYIILKVAFKSVTCGELDDVREESDSEEVVTYRAKKE
ncbi:Longevity-assurance protein [Dictyocaulus viviparus]|uniref:Longevity-assurance protein n=1 Tax=Dictyocaulus viviparus TaxID=29172 RepID=A0A0D8XFB7_DICVI|nr:Longevity-assurance protein [Dictyocaulus viviparus]